MLKLKYPEGNQTNDNSMEELDSLEVISELDEEILHTVTNSVNTFETSQLSQELQNTIASLQNPDLAQLLLDKDLCVLFSSPRTEDMFKEYYKIEHKPFFNIFHKSVRANEMQKLIISLKSKNKGFAWAGTLIHKTPTTRTLLTRTSISPFFTKKRELLGFSVLFEDVTIRYNKRLRSTFNSILEAAKLKDNDTGLHNERVSFYARKMAEYLYESKLYPQIDLDFIDNIGFLGAMHDVGKIGTPDYILQKPGKLSELEWEIMREHTINGAFILSSYPNPMAKEIALSHHEWWDGSGYPFKLEGHMIPLSARIVTIADVYDALRMKRTYKNEFTHEETTERLLQGSNTHFDPTLIATFQHIHSEFDKIWNLLRDNESNGIIHENYTEYSDSV